MNKKLLISVASLLAISSIIGASALANNNFNIVNAAYTPKLTLTKANMSVSTYDEENYIYPISVSGVISSGDTFTSMPYNPANTSISSYLYGKKTDYNFSNPDNMFEITGNNNYFAFTFPVHIIATFDLEHSFIVYKEVGKVEEKRENFYANGDDGEEYIYYSSNVSFYSDYGKTFEVLRIELNWTC